MVSCESCFMWRSTITCFFLYEGDETKCPCKQCLVKIMCNERIASSCNMRLDAKKGCGYYAFYTV